PGTVATVARGSGTLELPTRPEMVPVVAGSASFTIEGSTDAQLVNTASPRTATARKPHGLILSMRQKRTRRPSSWNIGRANGLGEGEVVGCPDGGSSDAMFLVPVRRGLSGGRDVALCAVARCQRGAEPSGERRGRCARGDR